MSIAGIVVITETQTSKQPIMVLNDVCCIRIGAKSLPVATVEILDG